MSTASSTGHVYLLDADVTATSVTPSRPDADDLAERHRRGHGERDRLRAVTAARPRRAA